MLNSPMLMAIVILGIVFTVTTKSFAGMEAGLEYKTNGAHSVEVRSERLQFDFNASGVTKIYGWMDGVGVSYNHQKKFAAKADIEFTKGDLEYEGPLAYSENQIVKSGKVSNINTYSFSARGLFGYNKQLSTTTSIIPYTGWGVRYLHMDMDKNITFKKGKDNIDIASKYYIDSYIPLGIKFNLNGNNVDRAWSFAATIEEDVILTQHNGSNGLRGSMELQKRLKYFNLAIEPFMRYWRFAEDKTQLKYSTDGGYLLEPVKHITETGIALKIIF